MRINILKPYSFDILYFLYRLYIYMTRISGKCPGLFKDGLIMTLPDKMYQEVCFWDHTIKENLIVCDRDTVFNRQEEFWKIISMQIQL